MTSIDNSSYNKDETNSQEVAPSYEAPEEIVQKAILAEKSIGVEKAEILAKQWTKWWQKVIILFSAFLVGYAYGLDGSTRYIYTAYATASYLEHSLLSTVGVITAVAGAACQPIFARLSDVFGRFELFIVAILFYVVGTIIESQLYDVQRYCAGAVFYQIGYSGSIVQILFILGDISALKWRLFYSFVPSFPFIINTWISGNVTSAIGMHWSKGVGMWAYIYPLACLPMLSCMVYMRWAAGKTEEWTQFKLRQTKFQELGLLGFLKYLFWRLDLIGIVLLSLILGLVLVPLTIAGGVKSKWDDGSIIAPMVVGVVLMPVFVVWESYSKHSIAPPHLLKDRGIWSALIICFLLDFISGVESSFLYTVLMVAVNETQKSATRITSLNSFVSVVLAIPFSLLIVKVRRLKPFIIFGCCMWILALGLMIHYRAGTGSHAGVIGALCVLGFGTTFFTYPVTISLQACTNHEYMAVVLSLGYTVYRVGAAVGSAVSGAIWSQLLYKRLLKELDDATLALSAYSSPYVFIVEYPWGTSERAAMVEAYKYIQNILITVAICFCVPMLAAAFFLRNNELGDQQSNEELVAKDTDEDQSLIQYIKSGFGRSKKA